MIRFRTLAVLTATCILALAGIQCKGDGKAPQTQTDMKDSADALTRVESRIYGTLPDGRVATLYTLRNAAGMEVDITNYGGIITRWTAPDRNGEYADIALGFDSLQPYVEGNPFFGALVGRYGNRIAKGRFSLDGQTYQLATNNGENHLHGGNKGFDKVLWEARDKAGNDRAAVILVYRSPDGEEGYPGMLITSVSYTLYDDNSLEVNYQAGTDKPTVVNLTQHSYFNLSGDFATPITDHVMYLNADAYLPVDQGLIPLGELRPVEGSAFDFREPKPIGRDIDAADPQLAIGGGYDHCWVLNEGDSELVLAATVLHPGSGRKLEVMTTEPGVQVYTSNFLNGSVIGKGGVPAGHRTGFCLETQHFPDSPNREEFPSTRLDPGQRYQSRTVFKFTTDQTE